MRTNAIHEITYQELNTLLAKHAGELDALEMLAIAANMVGKIIAMQDQQAITPDEAMKIVAKNIEIGNAQAVIQLMKSEGRA